MSGLARCVSLLSLVFSLIVVAFVGSRSLAFSALAGEFGVDARCPPGEVVRDISMRPEAATPCSLRASASAAGRRGARGAQGRCRPSPREACIAFPRTPPYMVYANQGKNVLGRLQKLGPVVYAGVFATVKMFRPPGIAERSIKSDSSLRVEQVLVRGADVADATQ